MNDFPNPPKEKNFYYQYVPYPASRERLRHVWNDSRNFLLGSIQKKTGIRPDRRRVHLYMTRHHDTKAIRVTAELCP